MRQRLELDRMEVEEAGSNPVRLAEAIHAQFDNGRRPVPVAEIARALDIIEIRTEPLSNLEGALITTPERSYGSILVNGKSGRQRQTFTIAHELAHFLNGWHQPTDKDGGFWCSRADMQVGKWTLRKEVSRHQRQESEANLFAIELLAPRKLLKADLDREPDLAHVMSIASDLDISREAAARRYVDLHSASVAIAFSYAGTLRYWAGSLGDRRRSFARGDRLPPLPAPRNGTSLSDIEAVDPADWLLDPDAGSIRVQTLHQQNDHATTLVIVDEESDDDDDGVEDACDRFGGFR